MCACACAYVYVMCMSHEICAYKAVKLYVMNAHMHMHMSHVRVHVHVACACACACGHGYIYIYICANNSGNLLNFVGKKHAFLIHAVFCCCRTNIIVYRTNV